MKFLFLGRPYFSHFHILRFQRNVVAINSVAPRYLGAECKSPITLVELPTNRKGSPAFPGSIFKGRLKPVALELRVALGIAEDLAGGNLEDARFNPLPPRHVYRVLRAGLGGLHRGVLVVNRCGRPVQIEDLAHLLIEGEGSS